MLKCCTLTWVRAGDTRCAKMKPDRKEVRSKYQTDT